MDVELLEQIKEKVRKLPMQPGVYIMRDKSGKIIYVGKAKLLKNRVFSYFRMIEKHHPKVYKMVQQVNDFDYIVTDSEFEALVLECSMIKLHNPKYNILLKDDKGYHYIKISDEPFPRITEEKQHGDNGEYIGPYTSGFVVSQTVNEVNRIFALPTCTRKFPNDFHKGRPCLNYHLKQCIGLCRGNISEEEYNEIIGQAKGFIKSGSVAIAQSLNEKMQVYSNNMEFEKAARIRDRIAAISKITDHQKVIYSRVENQDVLAFVTSEKNSACSILKFRGGRLIDKEDYLLGEPSPPGEMRSEFLARYYAMPDSIPPVISLDGEFEDVELITNLLTSRRGKKVAINIPQRGEQMRLIEMALNNCSQILSHEVRGTGREIAALDELAKALGMTAAPSYIEAYDISNFGEQTKVAGMVVFEDGKPLRSAYKKFVIKSVDGTDDYASMLEVIERRFARYFDSQNESAEPTAADTEIIVDTESRDTKGFARLPSLILLDGGQGHVSTILPVIRAMGLDIPVFGMVKDDKHRTRAIAGDGGEISINAQKRAFNLVTSIQDEVHRFSISFSRQRHKKTSFESTLSTVDGIGPARAKNLFQHFKTTKAIAEATVEELVNVKGMTSTSAQSVYNFYHDIAAQS